ncbi:Mpo1-like protein [Pseudoalteromonas sp. SSDWG2]|uniref:Mpo1-like protein n=1 Tax=Pseudoalteromonas sp. SSDWG2 TaxID=3139391 RepID=UPI003BAB7199
MGHIKDKESFSSFKEFYPYYLQEHKNKVCRRLHVIGSFLVLCLMGYAIASNQYALLWCIPVIGYGFAWVGHFFFEKNKPATFTYPLYSFIGDWVMFKDVLTRKIPW